MMKNCVCFIVIASLVAELFNVLDFLHNSWANKSTGLIFCRVDMLQELHIVQPSRNRPAAGSMSHLL